MEKREKTLLIVLGVVVIVAVIIFVATSSKPPVVFDQKDRQSQVISSESIATALSQARSVMSSSKFLSLTAFGKVPVVVESFELGNRQPLTAVTAVSPTSQ